MVAQHSENAHYLEADRSILKLDLYFVGLSFTLLGAATQTAQLDKHLWPTYLELAGWFSLAGAASIGFAKAYAFIQVIALSGVRKEIEEKLVLLRRYEEEGRSHYSGTLDNEPVPLQEELKATRKQYKELDSRGDSLLASGGKRRTIIRILFVLGFFLILIARASIPFVGNCTLKTG